MYRADLACESGGDPARSIFSRGQVTFADLPPPRLRALGSASFAATMIDPLKIGVYLRSFDLPLGPDLWAMGAQAGVTPRNTQRVLGSGTEARLTIMGALLRVIPHESQWPFLALGPNGAFCASSNYRGAVNLIPLVPGYPAGISKYLQNLPMPEGTTFGRLARTAGKSPFALSRIMNGHLANVEPGPLNEALEILGRQLGIVVVHQTLGEAIPATQDTPA